MNSLPQNPFTRPAFWGRQNEMRAIYKYLLSTPPQCCAIIGETSFGKTTLLRYLADPQSTSVINDLRINDKFTFVYLDCMPYIELAETGVYASVQFWWDLYSSLWLRLHPEEQPPLSKPRKKAEVSIDTAFEFKSELEDLIRSHQCPVIFVLDNFEGIARLPLRDSEWLRSMAHHCAYVVASRHLLYLLYHLESWTNSSPLWNLFSDPIYIGLMKEEEAMNFIFQAGKLNSFWKQEDIKFVKRMAGRHPELIRIACEHLFELRLHSRHPLKTEEYEFLQLSIYRVASPICSLLWLGLADPELRDEPRIAGYRREKETWALSPHQRALMDVANGGEMTESAIRFDLELRGLVERENGKWRVFAEVMRQFVLKQEQVRKPIELTVSSQTEVLDSTEVMSVRRMDKPTRESWRSSHVSPTHVASQISTTSEQWEPLPLTYLEDKVYTYLKLHTGEVCDREEIKQVVWEREYDLPGNSALQKIIERIREKIEPDPNNPRYLIAVRGQGYMLREDPLDSSIV